LSNVNHIIADILEGVFVFRGYISNVGLPIKFIFC